MIKKDLVPLFCVVAAVAFFTEVTAVYIVDLVAADTGFRCIFIFLVYMAGSTAGIFMCAFQREVSFIMIKSGFFPACALMATLAFFTLLAVVDIGLLVTVITGNGCLGIFFPWFVAFFTMRFLMSTFQ